MTTHKI